jgi:hypothetical protein
MGIKKMIEILEHDIWFPVILGYCCLIAFGLSFIISYLI